MVSCEFHIAYKMKWKHGWILNLTLRVNKGDGEGIRNVYNLLSDLYFSGSSCRKEKCLFYFTHAKIWIEAK